MYSLNMPVSAIRTKVRQEFEKHRYVSQLQVVDVLLFQSHAEFQVSACKESDGLPATRLTMEPLRVLRLLDLWSPIILHCRVDRSCLYIPYSIAILIYSTGNSQLLEAALPCHEVLPPRRRPWCAFAAQFRFGFLGGPQLGTSASFKFPFLLHSYSQSIVRSPARSHCRQRHDVHIS